MRRICVALSFFVLICVTSLRAQTINTVAGGGPNMVSARVGVGQPTSVAFDANGNYYIAAGGRNRIFKVDTTDNLTVFAGNGGQGFAGDGGPATSASLSGPDGVSVDQAGNVYIADAGNRRIRKVDAATGTITTVAGNGTPGYSGDGGPATLASLRNPLGVAKDQAGNLYIADLYDNRIRKVDAATGKITTVAGNGTFGFSRTFAVEGVEER